MMDTQQRQEQQGISVYQEELQQVEAELSSVEVCLQELLERQSELTRKRSELKSIIEQSESRHTQQKDLKFWNSTDFEWTQEIDDKLESVFGLKKLRPMQRQTMNATMSGKDCLLIMPTGGGKSLCFQLPAVISKGLTLVVSPLVALMEDQQMALEDLRVPSAILTASSTKEEQKFVLDDMVKQNGCLRLLYVTPEKLAKSKRFMNKLEKCYSINRLSRLVIDEVHCCSQWGHDFRPDYKFLGIMKRQFPNTPILGLTATATTKVLEDVKKILNIPKALELKASFNRPNLFYEVREKPNNQKESIDAILSLIKAKFKNQSGIVYCFSRKESEEVTQQLMSGGVSAGCYHSDIDPKSRSRVHRRWLEGSLQVVVATIAFGMGIDKPDVRFVIHHTISKSMENLYQESGRAGRDGKRSDCVVFYRLSDVMRQSTMVFTEQTGLSNLHGIVKYCIGVCGCRRSVIARHFGEIWDRTQCVGMCDMCSRNSLGGSVEKRDITRHCADVLTILDAASSTDQRVTAIKLMDAWYGKGSIGLKVKSVKPPSIAKYTAERILAHMLVHKYLSEDFHFTAYSTICYIVSGQKAEMVRSKAAKVFMDFPLPPSSSKSSASSSSSSSSSQSSSLSKTSSSNLKTKSSNKPKLVVINMDKSHFNSMSLPSSSSMSSSSSSSKADSSLSSSQNASKPQNKKNDSSVVGEINRVKTIDSDNDLNFDDEGDIEFDIKDRDNNLKKKAMRKTVSVLSGRNSKKNLVINKDSTVVENECHQISNGGENAERNSDIISGDDDDDTGEDGKMCAQIRDVNDGEESSDCVVVGAIKHKKRKLVISSDDDDDDINNDENDDDDFQDTSDHLSKVKKASRLSLSKTKKKGNRLNNSILISDDE